MESEIKKGQILVDHTDSRCIVLETSINYVKYYLFYTPHEPYNWGKTYTEARYIIERNFIILQAPTS